MTFAYQAWKLGETPPRGFDIADCVADGWTMQEVHAMMKEAVCDALPTFPGEDDTPAGVEPDAPAGLSGGEASVPDHAPPPAGVPEETDPLKRMVRDWCFIAGRAAFRDVLTGAEMKGGAFDLTHQRHIPKMDYMPNGDVLAKPREVSASEWLIGYGFGLVVQDTMYLPQQPDPVVRVDGVDYLNSYLPGYVPVAAASYEGHWAVDTWKEHLINILPEDWELLLRWLAYNVQHPGKKVKWAPIIKGTQGDGKTTISKMLGRVMGQRNVKVVSTESMFSDFNSYAEGACVAFLEEIRVKGHNRHDVMNKLKAPVTNEVIEVVRKGRDGQNVPNVTNYLAFTNFEDALVIDADDRRWGVFFTRFADRASLAAAGMGPAYWTKLHTAVDEHADVLRAWLLDIDTSMFDPNDAPPINSAKAAMIANSISAEAAMLAELVSLGRLGVSGHVAATDAVNVAMKQDHGATLATTRMAQAFAEIGWRQWGQLKWKGKTRRIYIDGRYEWPDDEAKMRYEMKRMLDDTDGGVMGVSPLDDVMAPEPVGGVW